MINEKEYEKFKKDTEEHHVPPAQLFSKCSVSDYSTLFSRNLIFKTLCGTTVKHQALAVKPMAQTMPRTPRVLPLVLNALKDSSCLWCRLLQF